MEQSFVTLGERPDLALASISDRYTSNSVIQTSASRTFESFYPNQSIKSEYNRNDYNYFRPNERQPERIEENIRLSMQAYHKVGIVRNVIDLMGDFTCKGIRLVHSNPQQQRFFRSWFDQVKGNQVSERFCNYLYRIANVPVLATQAKVPMKIKQKWESVYGFNFDVSVDKRTIPVKYSFINPLNLEVIAPEVSIFTGKTIFALRVGQSLKSCLSRLQQNYKDIDTSSIVELLPDALRDWSTRRANIVYGELVC